MFSFFFLFLFSFCPKSARDAALNSLVTPHTSCRSVTLTLTHLNMKVVGEKKTLCGGVFLGWCIAHLDCIDQAVIPHIDPFHNYTSFSTAVIKQCGAFVVSSQTTVLLLRL